MKRTSRILSVLMASSVTFSACGGNGTSSDSVTPLPTTTVPITPESIFEFIAADPRFSILTDLARSAGLATTLSGNGPYTLFAPTNDAFEEFDDARLSQLKNSPQTLRQFLLGHLIDSEVVYSDILAGTIESLSGETLEFILDDQVTVNGAVIEASDYRMTNGMIHPVDQVVATR